jgi:hypothetical protein
MLVYQRVMIQRPWDFQLSEHMEVSGTMGYPSSINFCLDLLTVFSIINRPFGGISVYGNLHIGLFRIGN